MFEGLVSRQERSQLLDELYGNLDSLGPEVVIPGQPVTVTQNGSPAWVEYRPYDDWAEVCLDGRRSKLADVQLSDLISIVDEAEGLARTKDDFAGC